MLTARPASVCAGTKETSAGTALILFDDGKGWESGAISGASPVLATGDREGAGTGTCDGVTDVGTPVPWISSELDPGEVLSTGWELRVDGAELELEASVTLLSRSAWIDGA